MLHFIGFSVVDAINSKKDHPLKDLDIYQEIIQYVIRNTDMSTKLNGCLSKIGSARLSKLGHKDPQILLEYNCTIQLESGFICFGDKTFAKDINEFILETRGTEECPNKHFIVERELINSGQMYLFGTDGDGVCRIKIRVVDSIEPVLTAQEYKFVQGTSSTVILNFPSGKLSVQDGMLYRQDDDTIEIVIPQSRYKCQVYQVRIPKRGEYFYIVLCKTKVQAINQEKDVFGF